MKSKSFQPFINVPGGVPGETMEIALGSESAPREALIESGWVISDPNAKAGTPLKFKQYLAQSKGEFSIAKHGYVISQSGWFSERSLNYMASGKPVLVQDTGLKGIVPSGKGLLVFTTPEEAIEAIKKVNSEYPLHCFESRRIVEDEFEAGVVLTKLLGQL